LASQLELSITTSEKRALITRLLNQQHIIIIF